MRKRLLVTILSVVALVLVGLGVPLGWMLGLAGLPLGIRCRFLDPASAPTAASIGPIVPGALDDLVAAWRAPAAWEGMAEAGQIEMPAQVMAAVALDELVVHGWDLAVATGQEYRADEESALRALEFAASVGDDPGSRAGLYGPAVPVPADAPVFERLLGATGRDPAWTAR